MFFLLFVCSLCLIWGEKEICDFGYPQNSEIDTLKTYITTESIVSSTASDNAVSSFSSNV